MFRLKFLESLPYYFSRGNPSTAVVIILNDDGKKFLQRLITLNIWLSSRCKEKIIAIV